MGDMETVPRHGERRDLAPCNTLHFRPEGALVGDAAFFSRGEECHIFYLSNRLDTPPRLPRCQLDHAVSTDLLHWEGLPPALLPGDPGAPDDDGIGGPTIVQDGEAYQMFCAGTNPQVIYRARSDDLVAWEKDDPLKPVIAPDPRWYVPHDAPVEDPYLLTAWRDPFLFYDDAGEQYVMLTTARLNHGPLWERGCVAWTVSKDLKSWQVKPPLYSPGIGAALEVTEIFKMGERYYLVFCHGETNTTRYRIAERLEGPYRRPADDILLPNYMYAPRTAVMRGERYLIPWVADRIGGTDDYQPEWGGEGYAWGGALGTPQHIRTLPDGGIGLFYPQLVDRLAGEALLDPNLLAQTRAGRGVWKGVSGKLSASSDQGLARSMLATGGGDFILSCEVTVKRGAAAGLILRGSATGEAGYFLRLEPDAGVVALWRYPRPWVVSRPLAMKITPDLDYNRPMELKVLLHRHVLDAYLNDRLVISRAVHDYKEGRFGFFVEDAEAEFAALAASELRE